MKFIKNNLVVFFAGLFTIIMLIMGAFYAHLHYSEVNGMADIGAFLSGIFAPIAWVWFLASYAIQSSELKLQRKELTLQRQALETQVEELKHSVQAQQGSEVALKEQSEALKKQLDITAKQFQYYLEEKGAKQPLFEVIDYQLFIKEEGRYDPIKDQYLTTKELPDFFRVILANHKADCIVKSVQVLQSDSDLSINTYPKLELRGGTYTDSFVKKVNEKTEYI
ncbi:hypothetical protein [Psychrobacter phenylpyruvicus]|uniref:Uncharacterized protein n=1 Tax=Psychrobacter phenylpyruvicus TaxID=29432 RepID=A0A379LK66_9GAMM|nr:hypothetical protein [Psychrobacter phenylpyruvicus]SUD91010.1 Uncharacterised protein [Psychrobacter phenylpyruvicus]